MQVLVKNVSTSVNPVDFKTRSAGKNSKLPRILGGDVAGIVEEADEEGKVRSFRTQLLLRADGGEGAGRRACNVFTR